MHSIYAVLSLAALAYGQVDTQVPIATSTLSDIPLLGFGTWNLDRDNTTEAVSHAIQIGYRHIDCAAIYGNEDLVGKGIKDGLNKTGLSRDDIWVTSKLWNDHHRPDQVAVALDKTLSDLGLDYLNLYHMHWPVLSAPATGNEIYFVDTWHAMELLLQTEKTRHIGVSNFSPAQLKTLISSSTHKPYAHQMELHPYLPQNDWLAYHALQGIRVTAYSPLAGTNPTYDPKAADTETFDRLPPALLDNTEMKKIAHTRGCTVAQVALAWGMGRRTSVIPKSSHARRIDENFGSKDCELMRHDYKVIAEMGEKYLHRYNNPSVSWGVHLYDGLDAA